MIKWNFSNQKACLIIWNNETCTNITSLFIITFLGLIFNLSQNLFINNSVYINNLIHLLKCNQMKI